MKKQTLFAFFVIFTLSIAGCNNNITSTPVAQLTANTPPPLSLTTTTSAQIASITSSSIASSTPTKTYIPTVTPTITVTSSPTFLPETRLTRQCLEVLPNLPVGVNVNGTIILDGLWAQSTITGTFLLDMSTQRSFQIARPNENLGNFVISKDKKSMAFNSTVLDSAGKIIQDQLVVATADGQWQKAIPWEEKWSGLLDWTDDDRLLIETSDSSAVRQDIHVYLVLDPFSGKREILPSDYPGYIYDTRIPYWDGWNGVLYDPALTRVIYPQTMTGDDTVFTLALRDLSGNYPITSLENIYQDGLSFSVVASMPVWSPDSSQFAFVGHDLSQPAFELYRVSRDGQPEQLTNLSSVAFLKGLVFRWSPDGRKIVMLADMNPLSWSGTVTILILDVETKEIMDTCISMEIGSVDENSIGPIWSPDGQQFLFVDFTDNEHSRVILVDNVQGYAAQIAENVNPRGWMIAP
jgi:dipeptidyl aminopeptidase/acylaminoacyl peptidase